MWTSRTAPVQTAFLPRDTFANVLEWVPTFVCDRVVDAFFVADVAVNFRSAYRDNETGRLVFEPAEAARRYARSWLLIDIVTCLPINYIMMAGERGVYGILLGLRLCTRFVLT